MAPSKASKKSDSTKEKPSTSNPTSTTSRSQTRDMSEKQEPEQTSKSIHLPHPHLPHIPHPHLHHHNEKSTSSIPNPSSSPSTHKPADKTKPPSAHANFFLPQPKSSTSTTCTSNSASNSNSAATKSKSNTTTSNLTGSRPANLRRQTSVQTRYMTMLLDLDTIPRLHNILASFFTWILLAGYIVFPGTFTSLQSETSSNPIVGSNQTAQEVLKNVKNAPLLWIAGFCCGIGAAGMVWLWWRWRRNFVWLINRIFLPGTLNSLAGLISTLINVYTQQNRTWSISAKTTAIVSGSCCFVLALLFALYNFWILRRVKRKHGKEMRLAGEEGLGFGGDGDREDEGLIGMIGRKAREPALEPGSVV